MHSPGLNVPKSLPPIVLVVEDDPDTRELYETALRAGGMWASSAPTSDEALEYAEDIRPDAILSDIALGSTSGLELAAHLRANPRTAHIPIVAVTGLTPESLKESAADFDDVLLKPVELPVLMERLRRLIARGSRPDGGQSGAVAGNGDGAPQGAPERVLGTPGASVPGFPRPCPRCSGTLAWVERRQMLGVVFDYYQPCAARCGLFCYDHGQRSFITLVG